MHSGGWLKRSHHAGPEKLPAEFYQDFEYMLIDPFMEMINQTQKQGYFEPGVRSGEIALQYKKEDPRDVRNYRPITLLNVDYKIFAHMLVSRLKVVLDDIITDAQLGFVPGREISESTHFLKLLQAKLEESDDEGIIIALDWEKAFDRVSWEYLHQATEALGFGPNMRAWIKTIDL